MTAEELKAYILTQMTAEEALDKFIKTSIEHYEALKSCTDAEHEGNPLFIMTAAAMDMGWSIAIEKDPPGDEVRGAAFGTQEYLDHILSLKNDSTDEQNDTDGEGMRVRGDVPGAGEQDQGRER